MQTNGTADTPASIREHALPDGSIAVTEHWVHGVRGAVTVGADDRPLYRLMSNILDDVWVPDLMPATIAKHCESVVETRDALRDIDRGRAEVGDAAYGIGFARRAAEAIEAHRDRDPRRLVAVGCSASKHEDDGTMPAEDRYKGGYWKNKAEYGATVGDEWGVISAQFGLIRPSEEIPYYERTVGDLKGVPTHSDQRLPNGDTVDTLLDEWALKVYTGIQTWLGENTSVIDPRDIELEVLVGKKYAEPLQERGVFDRLTAPGSVSVTFPFQDEIDYSNGGGIGTQRSWMCEQVEAEAQQESAT